MMEIFRRLLEDWFHAGLSIVNPLDADAYAEEVRISRANRRVLKAARKQKKPVERFWCPECNLYRPYTDLESVDDDFVVCRKCLEPVTWIN